MKILFVSMPHPTHFHPMVSLAWALRSAGHEVRVAGHPDLTDTATGAGLTMVPAGKPGWYRDDPYEPDLYGQLMGRGASDFLRTFDWSWTDERAWSWEGLLGQEKILVSALLAGISNDPFLDDVMDYARHWQPDLVIWEQLTMGGAVVAEALGIPHARFLYGLDFLGRAREEFLRLYQQRHPDQREDPTREWLEEAVGRFGGTWSERLRVGGFTIATTVPGTELEVGFDTIGMRYVPYNGRCVVPEWLREPTDRRRVCLTLGTSNEIENTGTTVGEILRGLADLDVEVVVTLGAEEAAKMGELPANARPVGFVPLHDLLPTCQAIVHHGGFGSRLTSAYHGVPQLILGHGYDTMLAGQRQEKLGGGLCLPADSATPQEIRDCVARLVDDPALAAGAALIRADLLAQPSPAEVVPMLERVVAEWGR
ncbi:MULTISPECIES: activator-dependent family glycosyltransferase [Kitasatospora]|uniref:Activator-dependent family glycosyltransferase n=1 Tax=Kitasatospora cathayae TaxID=3004092 RepID=A0ABY7Q9N1_9ACTN|nr:activator-dependent family glycosyltransferase [Kitasatospora sp. HUAS 3-15]WBP89149.1 activator-dependent family glycosyltransferase [Kitasatospora sp. HUAS 3-15]